MDNQNRPHSRNKTVVSGSANVGKGSRVPTGGSPRPGNVQRPVSGPNRASSGQVAAGAAGALGLFALLPKKVRRIIVLILLVVVVLFLLRSCLGGVGSGILLEESGSDYSSTFTTDEDYTTQSIDELVEEPAVANTEVSAEARAKRVVPLGNGDDVFTIMVYMCGTDLESKYAMATSDLKEMANATISDHINLIVCTGGCTKWQNNIVSNSVNQIYQVSNGKLTRLSEDFGTKAMTDPSNLSAFIKFCTENYPANRNALIFWDHGGGSLSGYGYDEKNKTASSMTLDKINTALKDGGCVFDWIGYDACLMATLENALVCGNYADYLIASEETEPGTGWYYTNWLNKLSANPSMPTVEIGKAIIDDYVSVCTSSSRSAQITLSLTDLAELQGCVPSRFNSFAVSTSELLKGEDYQSVSNARANARQFSPKSKLNQIDLIDFANRIGTEEAKALANTLASCVKYNGSTISKANGVSIYFPYETLKSVNGAISVYESVGMDSDYTDCIKSFASLESAGQISAVSSQTGSDSSMLGSLLSSYASSGSSASPVSTLLGSDSTGSLDINSLLSLMSSFSGRSMPEGLEWMDTELIADRADYLSQHTIDRSRITASTVDGQSVLSLSEEEWSLIQTAELNLFADDGEGFLELGLDNVAEFTEEGDMLLDFDGTWLTMDGHVVAYFMESDTQNADGSWTTVGRIPVLLNGSLANLQVVFDDDNPMGTITGAYPYYEDGTSTEAKGLIPLSAGDTIQPICNYYTYEDEFSASYTMGNAFTLTSDGATLANMMLTGAEGYKAAWRLTDLYGNEYWISAANSNS